MRWYWWLLIVFLVLVALWPTSPVDTPHHFNLSYPVFLDYATGTDTALMCNLAAEYCVRHSVTNASSMLWPRLATDYNLLNYPDEPVHWYDEFHRPHFPASPISPEKRYIAMTEHEHWVIPPLSSPRHTLMPATGSASGSVPIETHTISVRPHVELVRGLWSRSDLLDVMKKSRDVGYEPCNQAHDQYPHLYERRSMRTSDCSVIDRVPKTIVPKMRWAKENVFGLPTVRNKIPVFVERFKGQQHFQYHIVKGRSIREPVFATIYTWIHRSGKPGKRMCFPLAHTMRPDRRDREYLTLRRDDALCGTGICIEPKPGDSVIVYNVRANNQSVTTPWGPRLFCDSECSDEDDALKQCGKMHVMVEHVYF